LIKLIALGNKIGSAGFNNLTHSLCVQLSTSPPLSPSPLKERGRWFWKRGFAPLGRPLSYFFFSFGFLGFFTFFLPLLPIAFSSYFENLFLISYFLIKRYTTCKPIATASPRISCHELQQLSFYILFLVLLIPSLISFYSLGKKQH
jgi:hypothetical protein